MPYDADLRASYFSLELNMSWFYEAMNDYHIEFDWKPTYSHYGSEDEKEAVKLTVALFERHIEIAFKDWTVYRVFGHKKGDHKYEHYEEGGGEGGVWEFLRDIASAYCEKNPKVIMIWKDDEDNVIDFGSSSDE